MNGMTSENRMKLATSVALAAVLIWQFAWLRADILDLRRELQAKNEAARAELRADDRALRDEADFKNGKSRTEVQVDHASLRE